MKIISCLFLFILIAGFTGVKSQETVKDKIEEQTIEIIAPEEVVVTEEEPTFIVVEANARFQGGELSDFREWVQKNLVYPPVAVENSIQGKIFIQFHVTSKGKVVEARILRGVDPSLDNEVMRVVLSSPDWEPAQQGGLPVKQQYVIPVIFDLGK